LPSGVGFLARQTANCTNIVRSCSIAYVNQNAFKFHIKIGFCRKCRFCEFLGEVFLKIEKNGMKNFLGIKSEASFIGIVFWDFFCVKDLGGVNFSRLFLTKLSFWDQFLAILIFLRQIF
jgi:hypothetical protein